ncbi:hypothetical protein SUGI_1162260 [Cryptomeria japonica]|nr:hypothetical protein SUGI_1162260 [Cryptomeria japonica]
MTRSRALPCLQWQPFKVNVVFVALILSVLQRCVSAAPRVGPVQPVFLGNQMTWIDYGGNALYSVNKTFVLGIFAPTPDVAAFFLSIKNGNSGMIVWTANRDTPISSNDQFLFSEDGNASLTKDGTVIWSTQTGGKGVGIMELQESGNLVLLDNSSNIIWQSFDHPTDTLLSNQSLKVGMKLIYWTMEADSRKTITLDGSPVMATLTDRYLGMYDEEKNLLSQFIFSSFPDEAGFRAAVLGQGGALTFEIIETEGPTILDQTVIPADNCQLPSACASYFVCQSNGQCQCPRLLNSIYGSSCAPAPLPLCGSSNDPCFFLSKKFRKKEAPDTLNESSDDERFLNNIPGLPTRKNFNPEEASEKAYFPAYAFKQIEEQKLENLLDPELDYEPSDERLSRAVKAALWCIQEDFSLRPSMGKVVQMLEGLMYIPQPPVSYQTGFRIHNSLLKSTSEEGTSSNPSDYNSQDMLSAVRLSGPR